MALFFIPTVEETFFSALEVGAISDSDLREAMVDFFATWDRGYLARYQDMCDVFVRGKVDVVLPKRMPLSTWLRQRMFPDIEVATGGAIVLISAAFREEVRARWKVFE